MSLVVECACTPLWNYFIGAMAFAAVQAGALDYSIALFKPFMPNYMYAFIFFTTCSVKMLMFYVRKNFFTTLTIMQEKIKHFYKVSNEKQLPVIPEETSSSTQMDDSEEEEEELLQEKKSPPKLVMRKPRNFDKELTSSFVQN